jgi:hypothetical protein
MQPEPNLGTADLGTRIRRIDGVHVVHICTYLVDVCLRTNHPINREIDEILPVDLPLGDAVARCPLTQSGSLAIEQLDPSPAGLPTRELLLIPQLNDPRRVLHVYSVLPEGHDLIPHFGWIRIPPPARMRLFLGPGSIRRADGWTMDDNILIRKHGERRIHRAAAGGVDDGGVDSTARGGRGGEEEAAPRGRMVDGIEREQLHKGVDSGRWAATGESVGSDRGSGGGNIMVGRCSSSSACFCGEPAEGIIWREKKELFPTESGKYPGGGGKKLNSKIRDNCTGHCSINLM